VTNLFLKGFLQLCLKDVTYLLFFSQFSISFALSGKAMLLHITQNSDAARSDE